MLHSIYITVAGVCVPGTTTPYKWWSLAPQSITAADRVDALLGLGPFQAQCPEGDTVAQSSVTSITLVSDDRTAHGSRPIDIFGAVGAEGLSSSLVWQTLGLDAGASSITIQYVSGASTIPANTYLHIGTEMIMASQAWDATATSSITCTRGLGGSQARPHRAALGGYLARTIPVTTYPTEWIGRSVSVYVDGKLWRKGFLVENPLITKDQVVLSYVSQENLLSVDKSGEYIPSNGTTLVPTTEELVDGYWSLWVNTPARSVPVQASAITQYYDKGFILGDEEDIILSGATIGKTSTIATRVMGLCDGWTGDRLGRYYQPRVLVTLGRLPYSAGSGDTGELGYPINANYISWPSMSDQSVTLWIIWDKNDPSWLAANAATSSSYTWYIQRFDTTAFCGPCTSNIDFVYAGNRGGSYNQEPYAASEDSGSPFDFTMRQHGVEVYSHVCSQVGYSTYHADPYYVGVISRRNIRDDETVQPESESNTLFGAPLAPMQPEPDWYTGGQTLPCPPNKASKFWQYYPVRPYADGDVHRQVGRKGCCLTLDMWRVDNSMQTFVLPCDVATAYWEVGMPYIYTYATVPGITDAGSSGMVSIQWEEPDGEVMTATANLYRRAERDNGSYCCYAIDTVTTPRGQQVAGFGTWPGHQACTITPPVYTRGSLGSVLAEIVSSADGTSGREYDTLADGLGCALTHESIRSMGTLSPGNLPDVWRFDPTVSGYRDYITAATMLSGTMLVGKPDQGSAVLYGPAAVPAGRPSSMERVAAWSDDDIIGLPTSSGDRGLVYTSYRITAGDRVVSMADWLASDLLGQGESCEIDLTNIYPHPEQVTAESLYSILNSLHDRYGVPRRRWSLTVPLDLGLDRCVGDVVSITSEYLVSATGQLGVSGVLARIMSITHDLVGGKCDVELLSWSTYGAGYSQAWDMTITAVSSTTYTLSFDIAPVSDPATRERQSYDMVSSEPDQLNINMARCTYYAYTYKGVGAGGWIAGYFTSWDITSPTSGTATMIRTNYISPLPNVGSKVLVVAYGGSVTTIPLKMNYAFKKGASRLL